MSETPQAVPKNGSVYRFGEFEADLRAWELRRNGARVDLQDFPFQVLTTLLERAGEVITREELRAKLWPGDVFVDFEDGVNTAVRKLRLALEDSANEPRFIETVPRRGYRFIVPVTVVGRDVGKRFRRQWVYAVVGTGLVVLTLAPLLYQEFPVFNSERPARLQQLTKFTDSVRWPAVSADGRLLAFMRGRETFGGVNAGELYLNGQLVMLWVSTPGEKAFAAIKAFPTRRGAPVLICDTCAGGVGTVTDVVSWSPDQKFFLVSFQSFPGMRSRAESFMVPLAPGMTLPRLPRTGIASDEDLASLPGVRVIHEPRLFGGPNGSYATVRVSALRNLHRVWLP